MHILFAAPGYKPAYRIGGPIASVPPLAETLVRKGHRVTVFTTNSNFDQDLDVTLDQPVNVDGVEVWYFRRIVFFRRYLPFLVYLSKSIGYLYAPRMARELDRIVPAVDLLHTHMPFIYPTYAAARAAVRHQKPYFYHQRGGYDPAHLKFRALKKMIYIAAIERPIMRQAAMVFALTSTEKETYRSVGVETPCRVIANGIDVGKYRQQPRSDFHRRMKIPRDAQVILFLGRLHPTKGAPCMMDAFLRIQKAFRNAVLVMAGPDEWGLEAEFRDQVQAAGISDRVFFPGIVTGEDKYDLLARADLFCLPSDAEGFSSAVLEALASGTPVLLSPGCNFPEVATAGAGRIATASPESWSDALCGMLSDPGLMHVMGEIGLDFARINYAWDRIADQYIESYQEGIRSHGASLKGDAS